MPFCDHNRSLLRRQPRAETIGHSPEGEGRSQRMVDQAYSVWFCLSSLSSTLLDVRNLSNVKTECSCQFGQNFACRSMLYTLYQPVLKLKMQCDIVTQIVLG